jgi:hypothetical protein
MRGAFSDQGGLLSYISPEARVPYRRVSEIMLKATSKAASRRITAGEERHMI